VKIRRFQFAMVPRWVLEHPDVRGRGGAALVLLGVQALSFERGEDYVWESKRALANELAIITGQEPETTRKYLRSLLAAGVITTADGVLAIAATSPVDNVGTLIPSGDPDPQSGDPDPHSPSYRDLDNPYIPTRQSSAGPVDNHTPRAAGTTPRAGAGSYYAKREFYTAHGYGHEHCPRCEGIGMLELAGEGWTRCPEEPPPPPPIGSAS
jgi:hypothetical protein